MKSLIVFYSRTNITKKLAEKIASEIDADIEEIKPKVNYNGKIGYARGGKDAIQEKIIEIEPLNHDPEGYDMVYLGGPVWAGKSATPLISYIKLNEGKFSNVKFFMTAGGRGFETAFEQLEKFTSRKPVSTLALTTKEVKKDEFDLTDFLK